MPIYETKCSECGNEKEVLTLSFKEELPKCDCGGELNRLPSRVTWRWMYSEGHWETVNGRQVYKGKGGPKRIVGGEQLNVHDDLPKMAEDKVSVEPEDKGDYLEEMD